MIDGGKNAALSSKLPSAYFAAKNGIGMVSNFGGSKSCAEFKIVTPVPSAPDLANAEKEIIIDRLTPIPESLLAKAWAYFRAVHDKMDGAEAILLIGWNRTRNKYYLARPRFALVGPGYLEYRKGSKKVVGTIHSHGGMGAFFSTTDDTYERGTVGTTPGIYLVMGRVNTDDPALAASIAGMGVRQHIQIDPPKTIGSMTDREFKYWSATTKRASEVRSLTDGFKIYDANNNLLWWTTSMEEATTLISSGDIIASAAVPVLPKPAESKTPDAPRRKMRRLRIRAGSSSLFSGPDIYEIRTKRPDNGMTRLQKATAKFIKAASDDNLLAMEIAEALGEIADSIPEFWEYLMTMIEDIDLCHADKIGILRALYTSMDLDDFKDALQSVISAVAEEDLAGKEEEEEEEEERLQCEYPLWGAVE